MEKQFDTTASGALRDIKALALDLDGTVLAPGAVLRERTRKVLIGCIEKGIQVIFCTGRSLDSTEKFRRAAGAEGPMVYFNGAIVADMPGGKVLGLSLLEREAAEFCVDIARREKIYYQIYFPAEGGGLVSGRLSPGGAGEVLMADSDRPEAEQYRRHTGIQAVFGDLREVLSSPDFTGCIKGMFITSPEMVKKIRPEIEERFGNTIYTTLSSPIFFEQMHAGVSKGAGLRIAMDHLGLGEESVLACGDEENDLPMFSIAGHSAAPANAQARVLTAAAYRFKDCAEEGLAEFLENALMLSL
ncbi:MAG: HAD hydrolase family protein [Spirochaetaceae bacterium]|jgi:Cof subfamily protein (haloacid dehalogenase superfamily)|nr:HAD hydrolase family protein [Spirochaetaceae bacterium]